MNGRKDALEEAERGFSRAMVDLLNAKEKIADLELQIETLKSKVERYSEIGRHMANNCLELSKAAPCSCGVQLMCRNCALGYEAMGQLTHLPRATGGTDDT